MIAAKAFFLRAAQAEKRLKTLSARLRHYEELGLSITSTTSAVGGHQQGMSRVELAVVGKVDAAAALDEQVEAYRRIVSEAESVIRRIPQEKYQQLLTFRYLCGWSFKSISDELDYKDPNSVYRAHGWALAEAQRILNQQEGRHENRSD